MSHPTPPEGGGSGAQHMVARNWGDGWEQPLLVLRRADRLLFPMPERFRDPAFAQDRPGLALAPAHRAHRDRNARDEPWRNARDETRAMGGASEARRT